MNYYGPSEKGTICPALKNEDYEYGLSGDVADEKCLCVLNDEPCMGRVIIDPDDQSSQFFSRGKCAFDMDEIKKCPAYGLSKETLKLILKEKVEKETEEKLNQLK